MHILIVDDDDDAREVVGLILRSEGHQVDEASDGVAALGWLRAGNHPSIILLDLMMPRLDGEGLLKAMRSHPSMADIPVVIISGHHAAQQKAAELGAAGYLVKPVELDQLLMAVQGDSWTPAAQS